MRLNDIANNFNWKNAAFGAVALTFGIVLCPPVYLSIEESWSQKMFCSDYAYLKGESEELIRQHASIYWSNVHPSNEDKYYGAFADWVNDCE